MAESDHLERAKQYSRMRLLLSVGETVWILFWLAAMVLLPISQLFAHWAGLICSAWWIQIAFYFTLFSLVFYVLLFPLHFYSSFTLEHRFGLSNLMLKTWGIEEAKRQLLSFGIALVLVEGLYGLIHFFPRGWWLGAWIGWILFSVVLGKLMPVLILPLFYKYQPIEDSNLRQRIIDLVQPYRLKIENVYGINFSKTTKKANAMFCGLGSTKRVILADNLLQNFDRDEIASVVAHEVGHYHYRHLWKGLALGAVVSFVVFWAVFRILGAACGPFHFPGYDDLRAFPFLCFIFLVFAMILTPLDNTVTRAMESEADRFALEATRNKEAFVRMMEKLGRMNLADPSPHPVIEFIFYSHPSIRKRIEQAWRWNP